MPINDYPEKEIRRKIISKINPSINKSRSKHDKGLIYIDKKLEARVKIPNDHSRVMRQSKSKYIASDLRLNHLEFNDLIDCPITGMKYYKILKSRTNNQRQHAKSCKSKH